VLATVAPVVGAGAPSMSAQGARAVQAGAAVGTPATSVATTGTTNGPAQSSVAGGGARSVSDEMGPLPEG
jgi:hypothetical protein